MCLNIFFHFNQLRGLLLNSFHLQCRQYKTNLIQLCIPVICILFVALLQVIFNYVVDDLKLDKAIDAHKTVPWMPYNWMTASLGSGMSFNLSVPYTLMYTKSNIDPVGENYLEDMYQALVFYDRGVHPFPFGPEGPHGAYQSPSPVEMLSAKQIDNLLLEAMKQSKTNRDMDYLGAVDIHQWNDNFIKYTLQYDFKDPRIKLDLRSKLFNAAVNSVTGFCLDIELMFNTRGCSDVSAFGIHDALVEQMTKNLTGDANKHIQTFIQQMPYKLKKHSMHMNLKEILDVLFFPLILNLMLPVFMYKLVLEKKNKLKEMMRLMGVKYVNYVISNVVFMIVFYMLSVIVLVILGIIFEYRVITQTNPGILIILFIGSCMAIIGLSHLLSSILRDQLIATVIGYFWVLFLPVVSFVLDNYVLKDEKWGPKALLMVLTLPISDSIYRISEGCQNMNCPQEFSQLWKNKDLLVAILFLYFDAILYFVIGLYFDLVLPQEWGKRKSPLFCFDFCLKYVSKWLFQKKVYYGESDPDEDEDVKRLRDRILDGELTKESTMVLVKGLTKNFGKKVAVNRVCFGVQKNEVFGLLGPNGAGKTTTIRCLVGLINQSAGDAYINGNSIYNEMERIRNSLGYCPQFDIQWGELTPREHLLFYSRIKGESMLKENAAVTKILRSIGLDEGMGKGWFWHLINYVWGLEKSVNELSGGMKRRLSIGISLCGSPRVVFLDEPTTGLDPSSKRQIWNIILNEKKDKSILITTHSMEEADVLSDTIGIMSRGNLVCCGSSLHLKAKYGTGYTLGINSMNHEHTVPALKEMLEDDCNMKVTSSFGEHLSFELSPHLGEKKMKVSPVFEKLQKNSKNLEIVDWYLNQTTLEDVFLNVIKKAREEEIKKEREKSKLDEQKKKNGLFDRIKKRFSSKPDVDEDDLEDFVTQKILEDSDEGEGEEDDEEIEIRGSLNQPDQAIENNKKEEEEGIVVEEEPIIIGKDGDEKAHVEYSKKEVGGFSINQSFRDKKRKRKDIQTGEYMSPDYDFESDDDDAGRPEDDFEDQRCVFFIGCQWFGSWIMELFLHTYYLLKKDIRLTYRDWCTTCIIMMSPCIPIFVIFLLSKVVVQDAVINHPTPLPNDELLKCFSWGSKDCYTITYATEGNYLGEVVMQNFVENEGLKYGKEFGYLRFETCELMFEYMESHLNRSQNGVCFNDTARLMEINDLLRATSKDNMELFFDNEPENTIAYTILYNSTTQDFNVGDTYDNSLYIKNQLDNLIVYHLRHWPPKNHTHPHNNTNNNNNNNYEYRVENRFGMDIPFYPKSFYSKRYFDVDYKPYPHIPASTNGQNVVFSAAGPNLISLSSMLLMIVVIQKLVMEKEKGLKQAMQVIGMRVIPYFCSFFIIFVCIAAIMSVVVVIAGCVFVLSPFLYCNQLILIFLFFCFDLSMISFAFFVSTLISSRRTGIILGFVVFAVCCILNDFLANGNDIYLFMDKKSPVWVPLVFEIIYPSWNFAKVLSDVIHKTTPIYDPGKREYVRNVGYGFSDLVATNKFDYDFGIVFETQPTIYSFLLLIFNSLTFMTLFVVITEITRLYQNGYTLTYFAKKYLFVVDRRRKEEKEKKEFYESLDEDLKEEYDLAFQEDDPNIVLKVQEIGKTFGGLLGGGTKAVKNVSFGVPDRCCFSLLGHNGAGKSTAINLMTGYHALSKGNIKVWSRKNRKNRSVVDNLGYIRKNIGVCHQEDVLFPDLTAREHLQLFAEIQGKMGCREISREIEYRLKQVSLWGVRNERVKTFSGGMKRRLSVAISCIGNPNVVLLDEPTTGMDPYSRSQVWDLIMKLKKEKVIVLTTHSMEEADALSDKIGIMTEGNLMCIGNSLHLKQKYGSAYILKLTLENKNKTNKLLKMVNSFFSNEVVVTETRMKGILQARITPKWFDNLSDFLRVLEEEVELDENERCVRNFGLTHTSLEDVYVKVTKLSNVGFQIDQRDGQRVVMEDEDVEEEEEERMEVDENPSIAVLPGIVGDEEQQQPTENTPLLK